MRGTYRPRQTRCKKFGLFSGIAYCMDCGYVHHYSYTRKGQKDYSYYFCGGVAKRNKICISYHRITERALNDYVLKDVQRVLGFLKVNEAELVNYLESQNQRQTSRQVERERQLLQEAEQRSKVLDHISQRLYEDNLSGKVIDVQYMKMSVRYESEQEELNEKIEALRQTLEAVEEVKSGIERFVRTAKKYLLNQNLNQIWFML